MGLEAFFGLAPSILVNCSTTTIMITGLGGRSRRSSRSSSSRKNRVRGDVFGDTIIYGASLGIICDDLTDQVE